MTYLDLYPNSVTSGVGLISALSDRPDVPWIALNSDQKASLERAYGIHSGFKTPLPAYQVATEAVRVEVLLSIFLAKWSRLWEDFNMDYSVMDAYRMDETITRDRDDTDNTTTTFGRETTTHTDDGGYGTTTTTASITDDRSVYGFNSINGVPAESSITGDTETVREDRDYESTDTVTNSGSDTDNRVRTEDETTTTTRAGNIGYTTPQELLRQDIDLWSTPYFSLVFADIDSFIMLQTYSF